jgi:hypothetical protein
MVKCAGKTGKGQVGECQQFCVRGRFDHHAAKNLCSKMMTNWVFAINLSGAPAAGDVRLGESHKSTVWKGMNGNPAHCPCTTRISAT